MILINNLKYNYILLIIFKIIYIQNNYYNKMVEVIFHYEENNIIIQCNIKDKMEDIIKRFLKKIEKNENNNNFVYLYDGNIINKDLIFIQQVNELDKKRNKMNIIVKSNDDNNKEIKEIISKDIICPGCEENILMKIKDFKINLYGCNNNHIINNILIDKYENTQKIDLSKIKCDECNENNKGDTHNNEFYICNTCNKNICPLCKSKHDKNHIIIKYDDKNYICKKHNESFNKFCTKCNENICIFCEKEHNDHGIIDLIQILPNKDELIKGMEELKLLIDKFKNKIEIIKEILNRIINMIEIYYKINNNIINNYNKNNRNYIKLINLNNIKNNNEHLIIELNKINNVENLDEIVKFSFDKYYNEKGEKYIGEMKNGLKDGKGILYYDKDDEKKRKKYKGDFKNDKIEGKGIFYWNDGNRYEGDFKNGKREGNGIYYYNNGDRYEGDYKNGIKEGKGKMYYNNGNRYEGDYKNGKREGKGIIYWNNGNRYEGDFKNGKKEGKGKIYYKDGKIEEGNWINDKIEEKGFFKFW